MKLKNRILFVNTNVPWGGGEKWHLEAGLYLKSQGYDVFYLVHPNSILHEKLITNKLDFFIMSTTKFSFLRPAKIKRVRDIIESHHIDTVITNLPQDFKLLGMASKKLNLKNLMYRRGMPHPIKNKYINRKFIQNEFTHIIANSLEVKTSLLKNTSDWFPKDKIQIIYNGIKLNEIKKSTESFYEKTKDEIILGNAGRLVSQKGQKYLIELAKILKGKGLKFKILIAGTGPLKKELMELRDKENLSLEILFLGHVKDMNKFFNSIDLFVFPSIYEGLSNTLLEAMAQRIPCVGFNTSSIPEVIKNNHNGYLVSPFDIKEMANKIFDFKNANQEELKENAYNTIKDHFDFNKNIEKLTKLFAN